MPVRQLHLPWLRRSAWIALILFSAVPSFRALEIPLKRGQSEGNRVGFVDMEKIFREYPETQKARTEYFKEVERRRAALAEKERQLALLDAPAAATGDSAGAPPAASTGLFSLPPELLASTAPAASPADPAGREEEKRRRREEIESARQSAAQALKELEQRRSLQILGSLYKALIQLADERGIDLVVDKSAILYGQSAVDLTEALGRRIRGLPDEVK